MDILCAYHSKNIDTCKWVIERYDRETDNITVRLWVEACKEYLQKVDNQNK